MGFENPLLAVFTEMGRLLGGDMELLNTPVRLSREVGSQLPAGDSLGYRVVRRRGL